MYKYIKGSEETNIPEIIDTEDFKDFPLNSFYHYYVKVYSYLYNNDKDMAIQDEYIEIGDDYLKKYNDTARQLCTVMHDIISSDREAAAFGITMDAYLDGIIKGKKKTTKQPVNDFGIKVGDIFYSWNIYKDYGDQYKFYQVRELAGTQSVRLNEISRHNAMVLYYTKGRNENGEYDLVYSLGSINKTIRAKQLSDGEIELNLNRYETCWQYTGQMLD